MRSPAEHIAPQPFGKSAHVQDSDNFTYPSSHSSGVVVIDEVTENLVNADFSYLALSLHVALLILILTGVSEKRSLGNSISRGSIELEFEDILQEEIICVHPQDTPRIAE